MEHFKLNGWTSMEEEDLRSLKVDLEAFLEMNLEIHPKQAQHRPYYMCPKWESWVLKIFQIGGKWFLNHLNQSFEAQDMHKTR